MTKIAMQLENVQQNHKENTCTMAQKREKKKKKKRKKPNKSNPGVTDVRPQTPTPKNNKQNLKLQEFYTPELIFPTHN